MKPQPSNKVTAAPSPAYPIEAEQTTLGAMLNESIGYDIVSSILSEEDFYSVDHRTIYKAICQLATAGRGYDTISVLDRLEHNGKLAEIGGQPYLSDLALNTPTSANLDWWALTVRRKSLERKCKAAVDNHEWDKATTISTSLREITTDGIIAKSIFIDIKDLCESPPTENWLIKNYLTMDSLCLLFGDAGCGKSFLAIDIACHVATGREWRNQQTKQGNVLYIAGEGKNGLARRFKSWFVKTGEFARNITVCNRPIQLTDTANIIAMAKKIKDTGPLPKLIVIDTINRNFGVGDENDTADMTNAVHSLDILRTITGATVLGVHHSGHAEKGRGRGSSVLIASLDCEFAIEKFDATVQMRCTKAKDFDAPNPLSWSFKVQNLPWADEEGQPMNSAILLPVDHIIESTPNTIRLGHVQKKAIEILQALIIRNQARRGAVGLDLENIGVDKQEWYAAMDDADIPKNRRSDAKTDLHRRGIIHEDGRFVYLNAPKNEGYTPYAD